MKKRTGAHSAMAELLSKSNETQIKDIKAVPSTERKPAPAKSPSVTRERIRPENIAVIREDRPAAPRRPVAESPQMAKSATANGAGVAVMNRAPAQDAPARKIVRRKKRFNYKLLTKVAAVFGVAIVAVVIIYGIVSGITTISDATIVPDAYMGVELKLDENAKKLNVAEYDAVKHDGRNYITIEVFDGDEYVCSTGDSTVGQVLDSMSVKVEGDYVLRGNEADSITSDSVISIDKVTYATVTQETAVPYETKYVDVQNIARGKTKVVTAGKNGVSTATFNVTYVNGVESERVLVSEVVTTKPTTQVVNRGVGGTITIGGKTYSYSHYIDCKTTVYTGGGITASGLPATEKVIAVDPRVIPLGTQVYVADSYCYVGFRIAADTGGVIKGNFIDIYFDESNPSLWGYGVRSARVYILD